MNTEEASAAAEAESETKSNRFEMICGVAIAVFAAVLAVNDLGAGKYGDDELIAHNQKNNAYLWYQTKGIKETLVEEQRNTLQALVAAGSVDAAQLPTVETLVASLNARTERYGKEKKEILLGSKAVGEANWVQEVDGTLGRVVGAKDWEAEAEALGGAGDTFDLATLFLQICLVLGAISLVLQQDRLRAWFFRGMVALGTLGLIYTVLAYRQAMAIG